MYDRLLSKYSPHRPIPKFVRSFGFRLFMVFFIFAMFGIQMYFAWGDWGAMGLVFWKIILMTTIVGVTLSFIYAPRTWCSFCPMGSLSSWVSPKKAPLPKAYKSIHVRSQCEEKCKLCARVCPIQLTPYSSRGEQLGYLHPDCLKCRKCEKACPTKIVEMKKQDSSRRPIRRC
jgi:polyferredoxin